MDENKPVYEKPVLECLGKLVDLTLGSGGSIPDGMSTMSMSPMMMMMMP